MSVKITFVAPANAEPTVKVEALGFTGNSCEAATARIERALGQRISDVKKPEFYDEVVEAEHITEGLG